MVLSDPGANLAPVYEAKPGVRREAELFVRHPDNPILTADALDANVVLVFNPGVVRWRNRFLMAYRADLGRPGDPNLTGTEIGFAVSDDGLRWEVGVQPTLDRRAAIRLLQPLEPHADLESSLWRIYAPRLSVAPSPGDDGDRLLLSFAVDTTRGLRAGLAVGDGERWEAVDLGPPANRNQVVFPARIGDHWYRLERPMHDYGGEALGAGAYGIWVSRSPDLVHWGATRYLCGPESFPFGGEKVGPGAPPVRTDAGWLCIVHTVSAVDADGPRGWEPDWRRRYDAAAMLLDLDDPSRVLAASDCPLLAADGRYRYESTGFRDDVIFPTAAVLRDDDLWVYYGAADTSVALAVGSVDAIVSGLVPVTH